MLFYIFWDQVICLCFLSLSACVASSLHSPRAEVRLPAPDAKAYLTMFQDKREVVACVCVFMALSCIALLCLGAKINYFTNSEHTQHP